MNSPYAAICECCEEELNTETTAYHIGSRYFCHRCYYEYLYEIFDDCFLDTWIL